MNTNMKILLTTAGLSELFSGFSASCMTVEAMNTSEKLEEQISALKKETDNLKNELFELRKEEQCKLSANLFENEEDLHDVSMEFVDDSIDDCNNNIERLSSDDKDLLWYKTLLKYLEREKEIIGKIEKFEKEITNRHVALEYLPSKDKWQITNDYMMIIGKYFESNNDYVNVMKVNKRYNQLVLMYHFNPISDISLFENIQTQHFYNEQDVQNKKDGLYQYIYWVERTYDDCQNKQDNEIFKNVVLLRKSVVKIENGKCIVPEGVSKIGDNCLSGCSELTNITLPSTLKEIGQEAFYKTGITSIIIPEGVRKIGNSCFCSCSQLTNIILPSTLKAIGKYAFCRTKITSIIIPEGVRKIGDNCFESCGALTNITLPSMLKEIENAACSHTNITSIIIPEGVRKIGDNCFESCGALTNITLPSTLKEIGYNTFYNTKLTSIIIPEGITMAANIYFPDGLSKLSGTPETFKNMLQNLLLENDDQIQSVVIPGGVSKIGNRCFYGCSKLTEIKLPSTLKEIGESAFQHTKITSIIIPEGVSKIGDWGFSDCGELTNITLPSTLKEIARNAFCNTNITSIIIPEGVSKISNACFSYCSELTNITLPSTLKEIGYNTFYNTKLTSIIIPEGVIYNGRALLDGDKLEDGPQVKVDQESYDPEKDPELMEALKNIRPNNTVIQENIAQVKQPDQTTHTTFEGK